MKIGLSPQAKRVLGYGAIGAGLAIVAVTAVAAFGSLQVPFLPAPVSSPVPALDCTPAPCADLQGYTLWVTNLNSQGNVVTMQITFRNSSDSTHAAPATSSSSTLSGIARLRVSICLAVRNGPVTSSATARPTDL